jgi:D-3-phosphoglycerate dehydrogenase
MKNVYCLNNISKVGLSALPENFTVSTSLEISDAILVRSAQMHETTLPSSVLVVARAGAGVNNIPLDPYGRAGVVVFNTPGANANAVKELMIAGMLLASRDIYGGIKWIEANKSDDQIAKTVEKAKAAFAGTEIFGKSIGIIGLGAIGLLFANACEALGMRVYGTDMFLDFIRQKKDQLPRNITLVETNSEIYRQCDFISVNVPLTPETKEMLNKDVFELMKDGVVILNFARDTLVNDTDLEQAIESKKVKAYVTDFPNFKTVNMKGVIAIPHLGASTEEAEDNCAMMAVRQVVDFIEKGTIINSVNYPRIDAGPMDSAQRVIVLHQHVDQMGQMIADAMKSKVKISKMATNANDKFGVTILDTDVVAPEEITRLLQSIPSIYRIRIIK